MSEWIPVSERDALPVESRSFLRRKAAMRGEPAPEFGAMNAVWSVREIKRLKESHQELLEVLKELIEHGAFPTASYDKATTAIARWEKKS